MRVRDRVRELRRVRAKDLRPHPRNWRTHPARQHEVLRGVLAEIGYADALLVRELPEGGYQLIDGHLRAETTPEMEVPVLVVDLDEAEAEKLLVLLDPLTGLAETNGALLDELLANVDSDQAAVRGLLADLGRQAERARLALEPRELELMPLYQIVVECRDEAEQRTVFDQLRAAGHTCRVLTL